MKTTRTPRLALRAGAAITLLALASACRMAPQSVQIPMRDGKSLAADIYLPSNVGTYPTILVQTPYDRAVYQAQLPFQADAYAFVIVDMRGYFGSVGAINPSAKPVRTATTASSGSRSRAGATATSARGAPRPSA
ncbi:MAG: hypothetical protein IPK07_09180 [Deltaproteobacteria bacterium]|nr:hypothetical protein [Deltaproteobacteria bacterium]